MQQAPSVMQINSDWARFNCAGLLTCGVQRGREPYPQIGILQSDAYLSKAATMDRSPSSHIIEAVICNKSSCGENFVGIAWVLQVFHSGKGGRNASGL